MTKRAPHAPIDRMGLIRTRRLAGMALFWERLWPLVLPLACVISLFLTVSWLGLWPLMADPVRYGVLAVFALALLAACSPLRHFSKPTAKEIDSRIERVSALANRPVTAQVDQPSPVTGDSDPFAKALWAEHQRRMAAGLNNLKSGTPVPRIAAKDPYALRAVVGLLLFIGVAAGWGSWSNRIGDAFISHNRVAAVEGRIDAWVTPPAYTNRPPIFLSRNADAESAPIVVPEGSELVIRVLDLEQATVGLLENNARAEDEKPVPASEAKEGEKQAPGSEIFKTKLAVSSSVLLRSGQRDVGQWRFDVTPDADPVISFVDTPRASTRGALEFSFKVEDDYGVAGARAVVTSNREDAADAEPLIEAPDINLPLPSRRAKEGTVKTSQDLTAHPWAGAEVTMMLKAEDAAGQTGESAAEVFVLPERIFVKPLARAIVFERRNLALDARARQSVAEMLDIITTTHPDEFIKDLSVYTALRVIHHRIRSTQDKDQLRDVLDLMWETALAVEDGDLSRAERRLRDAQERLSKALEDGASEEEISELMKELRQAMNEFMQELAEQMAKNPQNQQNIPFDENAQMLRQQDLERMMQQIEDLAKSGSRDAARQLLEELQRMMNNLQTAQPNQQQQQQNDQFSEQMNKLGEMMRQQQQLMDQTFDMQRRQQQQQNGQQQNQQNQQNQQGQQQQDQQQQGQQGQQGEQKPMTPEEFAEAMKRLQQQQGELQKQMQEMQQALRDMGIDPGKLGEAGEAMGDAEQNLGQGQTGQATGDQGRALQAMRDGAQQMMQNMQNQAGEQGRRGERGQHGQQTRQDQDPLGRQSRSQGPQIGDDTKVPEEIDAQRAREILDAIRRKLGETTRPRLELDYLDRLLPTR